MLHFAPLHSINSPVKREKLHKNALDGSSREAQRRRRKEATNFNYRSKAAVRFRIKAKTAPDDDFHQNKIRFRLGRAADELC